MRFGTLSSRVVASALALSLLGGWLLPTTALAASRSSKNVAYVTYDDSGFTEFGPPSANVFSNAIVGGPRATTSTGSVTFNGMTFTPLARAAISTSTLANFDTLILFEVCDIATSLTSSQHQAINDYLAAGNKILLFDGDRCAPGVGGNADYSWFQFKFATSNPGPRGAFGSLQVVENSTLTQGLSADPFNLDELGDANTATTSDPHWFAAAKTTNALGNNGFFLAYARNSGLIIYNGADYWFSDGPTKSLTDLFVNELNQVYDPDNLPSTTPISAARTLFFVHGINQNAAEIQASLSGKSGDSSFNELFDQVGASNVVVFRYYQDKAYAQGAGCNMPANALDTSTGNLFVDPNAISSSICDSKSALAYDATKLDDDLIATAGTNSSPMTILAYSMGGAITRGWLELAQTRESAALKSVDSAVTFQGAQQGSYTGVIGRAALNGLGGVPIIGDVLAQTGAAIAAQFGFDPNRPGIVDLTPRSKWYGSVNPVAVPSNLHYYNVYSDIGVQVHAQFFGQTIPLGGPVSFGDLVMLPGDPNPAAMPALGGARFLPNGAAKDRHEWAAASVHDFDIGDLLNDPVPAVTELLGDPRQHLALNGNLNTGAVLIASCQNGAGQVRPLSELLRVINQPDAGCS